MQSPETAGLLSRAAEVTGMWAYRPTTSVATAHPIQATAAAPAIDQADHPRAAAASSVMWADSPFVLYSQGADIGIWANKPVASAPAVLLNQAADPVADADTRMEADRPTEPTSVSLPSRLLALI